MAARIFRIDELATRIATHLLGIRPIYTVALALTCRDLEVPALRTLWGTRGSFRDLIKHVLSTDVWCLVFPRGADICLYVSPILLPGGYSAHPLIMENSTGVEATAHRPGAE